MARFLNGTRQDFFAAGVLFGTAGIKTSFPAKMRKKFTQSAQQLF